MYLLTKGLRLACLFRFKEKEGVHHTPLYVQILGKKGGARKKERGERGKKQTEMARVNTLMCVRFCWELGGG
jgi:hypothetical protein